MPQVLVSGRTFDWSFVTGTAEFRTLPRSSDPDQIDVLRISSPGTGFDVAIRVDVEQCSSRDRRYLGPLLVIGKMRFLMGSVQPVRINSSGGRWVGYGLEGAASLNQRR
ncbi:hypothetical protein [Variovorax sp. CCNWLW235]|jgi:hypothetical protein|uniref:hypothetical protein n=1 Tax=Variovorax sp. CCNWLW235 TaxID=3127463 RepID=UPI00307883ED